MKKVMTGILFALALLRNLLVSIVAVHLLFFSIPAFADRMATKEWLQSQTGVIVPKSASMIYEYDREGSFAPGRAFRYYVFQFSGTSAAWLEENNFEPGRDGDFEKYFFDRDKSRKKEIPENHIPNFQKEYWWYKTDGIYFVYLLDTERLIILVSSM